MSITEIIIIASHIPIVISATYALVLYKKLEPELKLFSYFLFLSFVIQITALILALRRTNNLPLLHIYVAAGFLLLALFYIRVLNDFIKSEIIGAITILFLIYTTINSLFIESFFTFNSTALTVESILVVILSLSTFMVLLNDIVKQKRSHIIKSINWINSGLFIYNASSLLIFFLTRNFPKALNQYTWILHSFFSVVMYICFIIGFSKRNRN